ncbi:hypothetical protein RGQ15_11545 [Paracoccus sp. MBLB3053]|uniref:Uncharacterized protein n=1 Tax=Paracoccus aurantius TaxID=3073814 RepID=A0ABU2HUJ2_9RHOB|nr:hypothetical protein [Paracoccus sp. MBLB3053]MDS9468200.1 hypothetical protein [Paracoccus sp. MBLB3053]
MNDMGHNMLNEAQWIGQGEAVSWPVRSVVRGLTIQQALEWAFATEYARLDFDQTGEFFRGGVDALWILQRQRELGCRIDGGGTSEPHADAQIIASFVERLPVEYGGRQMATRIAELARARRSPDWAVAEARRFVPTGWKMTDAGEWLGETRKLAQVTFKDKRGRVKSYRPEICPVSLTGSGAVIAQKRREYLAWYGALMYLLFDLSRCAFSSIRILDGLPEMTPWKSS